jgi:ATP-dependent exoDNAse (exonuclease V) beta subunit
LIHTLFQQVQWLDAPLSEDQLHAIINQAYQQSPQAAAAQWDAAVNAFKQAIASREVIRALSEPRANVTGGRVELWRERPFAVRLGSDLVHGILDRVVIHRDATGKPIEAHLLDYKTDRVLNGQINPLATRYRPQLQAYRKAVAIMLNLPASNITSSLLLLNTGQLVPVS